MSTLPTDTQIAILKAALQDIIDKFQFEASPFTEQDKDWYTIADDMADIAITVLEKNA